MAQYGCHWPRSLSRSTLAEHDAYDPSTDRWTTLAPLPRSEGSPAAAVFNGKLYAIGGRSGFSDFGDVDIYDPAADTWSAGPAIPPRGTAGAAVYCNAIYLVGGESQARAATLDDVLRLDAHAKSWQARIPMPTARNFARTVVLGDAVYVVGGNLKVGMSHASKGSTVVESFRASCAAR